jgi:hypothetical protein
MIFVINLNQNLLMKMAVLHGRKDSKTIPKHDNDLAVIHNKQINQEKRLNLFETQRENENIKKKKRETVLMMK